MRPKRANKRGGRGGSRRGKVRIVRARRDPDRWPPPGSADWIDVHAVLGAGLDGREFAQRLEGADAGIRDKLMGVVARINLVNALDQETSFSSSWNRMQADALQVYLLCTCFDTLAGPTHFHHFHEWVSQEGQEPLVGVILSKLGTPTSPTPGWYTAATKRLGEEWLESHGVGRSFKRFFFDLPSVLRRELQQSYAVIKEDQEERGAWGGLPEETQLRRIVDYLFKLRRNTFTHQARIVPTFVPVQGLAGWVRFIRPDMWDYSVFLQNADQVRGEIALLRIVLIGAIRQMLGYPVDDAFCELHWKVERARRAIRLALRELIRNESLRSIFLRQWPVNLATAPPFARPNRLANAALGNLGRSRDVQFSWFFPLTADDDRTMREEIMDYVAEVERINSLVADFQKLSLSVRVWPKTKIAAYERLRESCRDGRWTDLGETIATNLYFVLESAPERLRLDPEKPTAHEEAPGGTRTHTVE